MARTSRSLTRMAHSQENGGLQGGPCLSPREAAVLYITYKTHIYGMLTCLNNFETKLLRRKAICSLFKMATGNARKRVRFTLDVTFPAAECKLAFLARLTGVRDAMTPPGAAKLDNYGLLSQLFSLAESQPRIMPVLTRIS